MVSKDDLLEEIGNIHDKDALARAFGAENRNRLIDQYFAQYSEGAVTHDNAWRHVYALLLWSDPTTGLAHCYESDKSQPGKPWYSRSLAFHEWVCTEFGVAPGELADRIDWLFVRACEDLATVMLRREEALSRIALRQRLPYGDRGFPEPGSDPELAGMIKAAVQP